MSYRIFPFVGDNEARLSESCRGFGGTLWPLLRGRAIDEARRFFAARSLAGKPSIPVPLSPESDAGPEVLATSSKGSRPRPGRFARVVELRRLEGAGGEAEEERGETR